jgi:hypothetical protein
MLVLPWRRRRALLLAVCAAAALLAFVSRHRTRPSPSGHLSSVPYRRTARELLDGELSQLAATVMVCLILTTEGNATLDQSVRLLNHAYMPAGVRLHLAVVSAVPVVIRKQAWSRGNCTLFRNLSLVRFRADLCFVLVQNTADMSPYFLYWMWRSWATRRADGLLISGDAGGTGAVVHAETWVRFVRSERVCGHADATRRYFHFFARSVANASVLHPPTIDGYALVRPEWQSMTEREREPRLARVWDERFVLEAVHLHGHK